MPKGDELSAAFDGMFAKRDILNLIDGFSGLYPPGVEGNGKNLLCNP